MVKFHWHETLEKNWSKGQKVGQDWLELGIDYEEVQGNL